ncbi:cyclic nucleotide-binding domain protein (macronuclear) [Tetrahymena thermophila SB210]|uniref:Cyclic nucleotide-binding domain protein n=1 Tax=Tetrahymena thermophila (strain SB210) TaxID=312017 RepID=A4VEY3_TETTS|nr:cyclic nucleotide-binding domain protein [Tetrahymena thermophila SB210]EDK31209.2 cyclic nucleotide-binding domain protein [Tetrahymena thermophila SB210]|eukprot:XP_001471510.2 cyclic nucleotide-binding domain protein [Tetrahymena thermophila SB210]
MIISRIYFKYFIIKNDNKLNDSHKIKKTLKKPSKQGLIKINQSQQGFLVNDSKIVKIQLKKKKDIKVIIIKKFILDRKLIIESKKKQINKQLFEMISDDNLIIASNNKSFQQLQNALFKEENTSYYHGIHTAEQNDSNTNQNQKKNSMPNCQQAYDSFSQRLIQFDLEKNQQKVNGQINSNNFMGKMQERKHLSYIKSRTGRFSEEDQPINQLRHQSVLRKVFNKVKISLQVKAFINKMIQLTQIQKYKVFDENPIFFNLVNDKSAYQNIDNAQIKVTQNTDKSILQKKNQKMLINSQTQKSSTNLRNSFHKNNKIIKQCFQKLLNTIPVFSAFSKFNFIWDQLQLVCLGYFFITIPLLISFNQEIQNFDSSWVVHLLISLLLLIDIIFNFNTSLFQQGKEIKSRIIIAQNYLKNQFALDAITLACISIFFSLQYNSKYAENTNVLNVCSIIFFLRYKQFGRVLKKIEMQYHFSPRISQILRLNKLFLTNIYIIHLLACVWIIIAKVQNDQNQTWLHINNTMNEPWFIQYLNAFYFNTVTMVTVGYGDISPQSNFERLFSILTVLSACGVFAYSISEVGSIFQEMNKSSKQRKNNLFVINNYMKNKKITSELQYQIRYYLEYYWNESLSENTKEELNIISQLSNNLKENLMIEANKILVVESPFFRDNFSFKTILKTVSLVQEQRCTPEEIIYLEGDLEECSIYFIEKGSVQLFRDHTSESILFKKEFLECNTLKAGQYFGEMSFFTGMERKFCVRSLEFTTLIKIERAKFIEIIKEVPSDYEKFCLIKDDIIFNKNWKHSMKKCTYCQHVQSDQAYHSSRECPMVHYIPNSTRLMDQFKYNNSLTQTERTFMKRQTQKHNNTLGRIEQVKGYQDRIAFQEESVLFAYIHTYGLEDFSNNQESSDNSISKSGIISSSNSFDEEKSCRDIQNNKKINGSSNSFGSSNEEDSSQLLSSPEKEKNFQNYIQSKKVDKKQKISKQISKSLVIEEDQQESESNQYMLSMSIHKNINTQNKTDEIVTNPDIEEQPEDLMQAQLQEKITNHSIIMNKSMPFTRDLIKNKPIINGLNKIDNNELSFESNYWNSQRAQNKQQELNCIQNLDLQKYSNQTLDLIQDGNNNSKQLIQTESNQEPQSSNQINISPLQSKRKPRSSILQSVKFKLPKKNLSMKNKSLQDINIFKDYDKGQQKVSSNGSQKINLTDNIFDKTQLPINQKQKQNSPLKIPHYLTENYKYLSPQQKKTIHKLKRFSSSGYVIQNSEPFLNSTQESMVAVQKSQAKQKQLTLNNLLQQRLSMQLDNFANNFQKIQDILINQTHTQNMNYHNKMSSQQNISNQQSMKEFDKMKIFEIYFPHNNYDEIIFQQNQLQLNKNQKNKYKNALAFSPSRRLQQNKFASQQNNFTGQDKLIKEMLNNNTLNRLKYLKNENNKKNSITDQLFISQLSLRKRQDTNLSLPVENTDQLSPCSNQNFFTQANQDEEINRGNFKQQYDRKCSIEICNSKTNQHNLIIPNYFGLQKQTESQSSLQGKKSRFSNRNSIFKNEQISINNSNNSNEKIDVLQNNSNKS